MQRNWIGAARGRWSPSAWAEGERGQGAGNREQDGAREIQRVHHAGGHDSLARPACNWRRNTRWRGHLTAFDERLGGRDRTMMAQQKAAREAGDLGAIEKHGVATGRMAVNPYNGEQVPIWIANYISGGLRHRRDHECARAR